MNQRRSPFRPQLEALEDRLCPSGSTVTLPISAFLGAQGTSSAFNPPLGDYLAFNNSIYDPGTALATGTTPNDFVSLISVDYTGQAANYLAQNGINLHTKIIGSVVETTQANGLMEVAVNLEATNALTWVAKVKISDENTLATNTTSPLELGYRVQDLLANPGLKPALSNVHFQFTWHEQAGAPLPDLVRALIIGDSAPPDFAPERLDIHTWGTGLLGPAANVGTPGQTAIVSTSQVADLTNSSLPGTLADGFWQEAVDLIPVPSASTHVGYLNGTLFVSDLSNGNDHVSVTPAASGGVTLTSNLGNGTYPAVTRVVVALGNGNDNVHIGNLPVTVDVTAFDGNNNITVGNVAKLVVSVGGGNNNIKTGNTAPAAQFVFVGGNGNNNIDIDNANPAEILVAGNGNNKISAAGNGDFIEVLGNGNNHLTDSGTNDLIWLGGDGNNDIDNDGAGSFTDILAGTGHNRIRGPWGFLM